MKKPLLLLSFFLMISLVGCAEGEISSSILPDVTNMPFATTTTSTVTTAMLNENPFPLSFPSPEEYLSPLELLGGYEIMKNGLVLIEYPNSPSEYSLEIFERYIFGKWQGVHLALGEEISFVIDDLEKHPFDGYITWVNDSVIAFGFSRQTTISDGFYWIDINAPDKMYRLGTAHWYDDGSDEFTKLEIGYIDKVYTEEIYQGGILLDVYSKIV